MDIQENKKEFFQNITRDTKSSDVIKALKNGVKDIMNSDNYKSYLNLLSSQYHYSLYNTLLIYNQKPNATMVQNSEFWKKQGRYINQGEHGLRIFLPLKKKVDTLVNKLDENKKPIRKPDGEYEKKIIQTEEIYGFKLAPVFDVSQTNGKELPKNPVVELKGNSSDAVSLLDAIKNTIPIPIENINSKTSAFGMYDKTQNKIYIKDDLSAEQKCKTLIHEYAHSKLHNKITDYQENRGTYEMQAESAAYVISNHFGLDTSEYSFGYVAGWADGKSTKQIEEIIESVKNVSSEIISEFTPAIEEAVKQQKISSFSITKTNAFTEEDLKALNQNNPNRSKGASAIAIFENGNRAAYYYMDYPQKTGKERALEKLSSNPKIASYIIDGDLYEKKPEPSKDFSEKAFLSNETSVSSVSPPVPPSPSPIQAKDLKAGDQLSEKDGFLFDVVDIVKETEKTITVHLCSDFSNHSSHWTVKPDGQPGGINKTFRKSTKLAGIKNSAPDSVKKYQTSKTQNTVMKQNTEQLKKIKNSKMKQTLLER